MIQLSAGARAPQVGDVLRRGGDGWEPSAQQREWNRIHVHTETRTRIVMGAWQSPDFETGSAGWRFAQDGSLEANDITARGTVYATAGEIGGWTIAVGHLYAGVGAARVGLKPGTYPFYAGAEAEASAPFRVNAAGELWTTNAHITGEIDANSGHLGTLDVDGVITVGTGTPVIQIDGPNKRIQSSNFASGSVGFRIGNDGDAEFNNVTVRGEIRTAVLRHDELHVTAGMFLVTPHAGKLASDLVVGTDSDFDVGESGRFTVNEYVRLKDGTSDTWLQVDTDNADGTYDFTYKSGSTGVTFAAGCGVAGYGVSGAGGVLLDAIDTDGPFMDVFTHAGAPWTTLTTKVRVGKLSGISDDDLTPSGYGLYASNVFLKGDIFAGDGNIRIAAAGLHLAASPAGAQRKVLWLQDITDQETELGRVQASWDGTKTMMYSLARNLSYPARYTIDAAGYGGGNATKMVLQMDSGSVENSIVLTYWKSTDSTTKMLRILEDYVSTAKDFRVGSGLYVGGVGVDPAAGTITASDYMCALGGLHVGGTSDPGTDNLLVDGFTATSREYIGGLAGGGGTWTSGHTLVDDSMYLLVIGRIDGGGNARDSGLYTILARSASDVIDEVHQCTPSVALSIVGNKVRVTNSTGSTLYFWVSLLRVY